MKTILNVILGSGILIILGGCCATNPFFCDVVASPIVAVDYSQFSDEGTSGDSNKSLAGFQVGTSVSKPIIEQLSLETGAHLATKGNKTSLSDGEEFSYSSKIVSTYLDVPVLARYALGQSGFSVYGGVQPSLLLSAKTKTSGTGGEDSQKITNNYKTLDLAGSVGVGYQFTSGFRLLLGYDHGLTDISNTPNAPKTHNRTLKFGIGYSFGGEK